MYPFDCLYLLIQMRFENGFFVGSDLAGFQYFSYTIHGYLAMYQVRMVVSDEIIQVSGTDRNRHNESTKQNEKCA